MHNIKSKFKNKKRKDLTADFSGARILPESIWKMLFNVTIFGKSVNMGKVFEDMVFNSKKWQPFIQYGWT